MRARFSFLALALGLGLALFTLLPTVGIAQVLPPNVANNFNPETYNANLRRRSTPGLTNSSSLNSSSSFNNSSSSRFGSSNRSGTEGTDSSTRRSKRDRDSSRRSRRDKDKTSTGIVPTPVTGAPARAAAQGKSAVPKGAKAGAAKGKTSGKAESVPLPAFVINPAIRSTTLYFQPSQVKTTKDHRFSSSLVFFNDKGLPIDRIDLWLHFQPEVLDPVWINLKDIKEQLAGEPRHEVQRESGYIHIHGIFKSPNTQVLQPIATINWAARQGPTTAIVSIEPPPGEESGLFAGATNALELSDIGNDGLVPLEVRIFESEEETEENDEALRIVQPGEDPTIPDPAKNRGVHLALVPREKNVTRGGVSTMDVVVMNPLLVEFDELRFQLRYDPETVEILDADEDNYIVDGLNIYDGGFHEKMPFDAHLANTVNPRRGTVDYWVANSNATRAYPSGPVARVVYRVKKAAPESRNAAFWFQSEDATGVTLTSVSARGRNVLGQAENEPGKALHNAIVAVASREGPSQSLFDESRLQVIRHPARKKGESSEKRFELIQGPIKP